MTVFTEKSHLYITYLLFLTLPFPPDFLPLLMGGWAVSFLLYRAYSTPINPPPVYLKKAIVFFLAFILIHFLSPLWSGNVSLGLKEVEGKLSLLIFALIMLLGGQFPQGMKRIPKVYLLGSALSILVFLFSLFGRYLFSDTFKYQYDVVGLETLISDFSHPAYWTMNLVLSFFLFLMTLKNVNKRDFVLLLIYYSCLGVFVFISGSRAGLISYSLCSLVFLFFYGQEHWSKSKTFVFLLLFVLLVGGLALNTTKFLHIADHSEHVSIRAPRRILWSTAVEMAVERPLFGYGIGVSKEKFVKACAQSGIYNAEYRRLNVHNQYLEYVLESGILSLLSLLLALYFLYKATLKSNKNLVLLVYFILAFAMLFESMLLRIAGLSSFVALLYYVLFLIREPQTKDDVSQLKGGRCIFLVLPVLFLLSYGLKMRSSALDFDPADPNTFATKVYGVVENEDLQGKLPPEWSDDVNACRYDSTAKASLWSGNAYSLNRIAAKKLKDGEILTFTTYCYVSEDFDGTWVRASIDREGGVNFGSSYYDLSQKGTWQKLKVVVDNETGDMPAYHYFCKRDCNSLQDLQGYVLFAYPQYIITEK